MTASQRQIVFYGNCQAGALATAFSSHPAIAERFSVRHLPSFDDPVNRARVMEQADVRSTAVLFEQHDPVRFPHLEDLPSDCVSATFPSIDFNLLWPLTRDNPYNDRSDPAVPWGAFPYGDRFLIEAIERGDSLEAILERYAADSPGALPDLDRFAKLERGRLMARDAKCDVKIADFVLSQFQQTALFWCVNHPTMAALLEIGRRLLDTIDGPSSPLRGISFDESSGMSTSIEPLALINVPVHPVVAAHFGLEWYEGMNGRYGLDGAKLTYEEYLREMVASSIAVRDRDQVGSGSLQDVIVPS
jgi:hypothetical protein